MNTRVGVEVAERARERGERGPAPRTAAALALILQASAGNAATVAFLGRAPGLQREVRIDPGGVAGPALQARIADLRARLEALHSQSGMLDRAAYWARSRREVSLTEPEIAWIKWWVAGGWGTLNAYLRGVPGTPNVVVFNNRNYPLDAVAASIATVLRRLPPFTRRSFRKNGYANPQVWQTHIQPGDHVVDPGFAASSALRGGGGGGAAVWGTAGNNAWFEVTGLTGRDIAPYSTIGSESEVLFAPDTVFQVDAIELRLEAGGGRTPFVIMHEVPALPPGAVAKNIYTGQAVPAAAPAALAVALGPPAPPVAAAPPPA